tara:strand:+ start:170 stop:382 length:213 start_codon:yes stop_codon:yes gene_type:complete
MKDENDIVDAKDFLEFIHSCRDIELVDFVKKSFDKYSNKEISEEILDTLIQEAMAEYGRRNHPYMKRSLH